MMCLWRSGMCNSDVASKTTSEGSNNTREPSLFFAWQEVRRANCSLRHRLFPLYYPSIMYCNFICSLSDVIIKTFSHFLHCLTVTGLGDRGAADIVACGHNHCAYISDSSNYSVHRIALSDSTVTHWPVNDRPDRLSLTYTHSVLVSCWWVRKTKEFSSDGQLLHVLTLPHDVVSPWHTIQLSSEQFIVCCGGRDDQIGLRQCICLTGSDSSVVKSFGGEKGSGSQQMNVPAHMAVDRNKFVFVADTGQTTRRVLF